MKKVLATLLLLPASVAFAAGPVIRPVAASCGVTAAHVVWSTDIAATSRVDYGTTSSYGSSVSGSSSVTWHGLTLTGLAANTTYHYKVTSGTSASPDYTFRTYANPAGVVREVGAGKVHPTLQSCANAANPGDTCLVYAGTYNETVAPPRSGSSGSPITFLAQEAAAIYGFNIRGRTYISIKGFELTNPSGDGVNGDGSHNAVIENNYMHPFGGAGVYITPFGTISNNVSIRKNIVYHCGWGNGGTGASGLEAYGHDMLIEDNDISHVANGVTAFGTNVVIRNNVVHDCYDAEMNSSEHIDGFEFVATSQVMSYILIEGNLMFNVPENNAHFMIFQDYSSGKTLITNNIVRFNSSYNIGSYWGILNLYAKRIKVYNNTMGQIVSNDMGAVVWTNGSTNGSMINNILYNVAPNGVGPYYDDTGTGSRDCNLAFNTSYSGSWQTPYSGEAHYEALRNKNPSIRNYPLDLSLQAPSAAIDAGGPVTSVASGDAGSGTSLVVADASFFQPGWAGASADWIAVGSVSNIAQITAINYGSNTITLASGVTRTSGQPVWLYKKSDGALVLYGAAPDLGAYEYQSQSVIPLAAPSNLRIVQ